MTWETFKENSYMNAERNWSVSEDNNGDLVIQFDGLKNKMVVCAEYEDIGMLEYRLVRTGAPSK